MSADEENGLIFLPTGNAPVDFYKGQQRPIDHYGSSVVALHIGTGEVAWSFRIVNHDLWDYDVAAQPVLYLHQGKIPAVAVATKQGNVFLLNRLTGEPLFPVEQRPVPGTDVPGEWTAPTQPFPSLPKPLRASPISRSDVMNFPIASRGCLDTFKSLRNEGIFTPLSLRGTLENPGVSGGFSWGSNSVDPRRGLFVGAVLDMPFIVKLVPQPVQGIDDKNVPASWAEMPQYGAPYLVIRRPFLSETGIPCVKAPWGSLVAIDLNTGEEKWHKPLGSLQGRVPLIGAWLNVGAPISGGVMQSAGGLVFVGATIDEHFRAFDADSGKLLWSVHLPYSAHATPMTYRLRKDAKQYVVVATGGAPAMDLKIGNRIVAFTLPGKE